MYGAVGILHLNFGFQIVYISLFWIPNYASATTSLRLYMHGFQLRISMFALYHLFFASILESKTILNSKTILDSKIIFDSKTFLLQHLELDELDDQR